MDNFPLRPRIDPLAMLSIAEIRGVIDLWQSKQNSLEVPRTINNTADLADALGITEYEVAGLLGQVRRPKAAVPGPVADAKSGIRISWWVAVPILLFAILGLFGLFPISNVDNRRKDSVQEPHRAQSPALATPNLTEKSPFAKVAVFSPEQANPPLTDSVEAQRPYGVVKYLSPEEVNRKARVCEANLITK